MSVARPLAATIFFILIWQLTKTFTGLPRFVLPSPWEVMTTWWQNKDLIIEHSLYTGLEVILGLVLGTILGAAMALWLTVSRLARLFLEPLLVFSQALPVFALAPILTLWFGYGLTSKVVMAILIIFFPVASSFYDGLRRTPSGFLDLGRTMQGSWLSVLIHIKIPAAIPSLGSGFKLAAVYAPIGAVIGEWVGSSQGLGYLMLLANGRSKTDLMFAAMLTLGCLSCLLYVLASVFVMKLTHKHRS